MAIDTRERRQAAVYFMRCHAVAPTVNVAKDQEWRQEVLRSYPGILAAAPPAPPPPAPPADDGQFLPAGWGGPAAPPEGTGPPGGAASGAPTGTAPIYGGIDPTVRARQLADAVCDRVTVAARGQQSIEFSLVQLLHCLQGRPPPRAPQSAERSLELIFRELGVARPRRVTLAQELDTIAANLP